MSMAQQPAVQPVRLDWQLLCVGRALEASWYASARKGMGMVKERNVGQVHMQQWLYIFDDVTLQAKKDEDLDSIFIALRAVGISAILLGQQSTNVMSPLRAQQATAVLFRASSEDNIKTLLGRIPLGSTDKKDVIAWAKTTAAVSPHVFACILTVTRDPAMGTALLVRAGKRGQPTAPAPVTDKKAAKTPAKTPSTGKPSDPRPTPGSNAAAGGGTVPAPPLRGLPQPSICGSQRTRS